jgi:hemerythrin-like domain-containing protein
MSAALTRTDTSDMIAVHRVFRESLGIAPQLIGSVEETDVERVATIAAYYANVLAFLHSHHEGEDELLWPKLIDRCPEQAEMVRRVADQHAGVLVSLAAAETHLAEWQAEPTTERGATLAASLVTLAVGLSDHLDEEERLILPLAAEHITAEEWGELPSHGLRSFSGDRIWLVMGLIREQMTAAQLAAMDAAMPPPVREFWTTAGEAQFTVFIGDVRR